MSKARVSSPQNPGRARRQALDVQLDQRLFTLAPEPYDVFSSALDIPPAPGPKLKALLRRLPAWQR